ncbi:hypothetical protein DZC78_04410 [Olleya aquimaris]|nr:hypothetical protein DZC78_04410 [Olleya aquimaris]
MNKFKFIKQLLDNEKFNTSQKERFLSLVSKELETTNKLEVGLINDVKEIKETLGLDKKTMTEDVVNSVTQKLDIEKIELDIKKCDNINKTTNDIKIDYNSIHQINEDKMSSVKKNEELKYLSPQGLRAFLIDYNQDPILKYTCHQIDDIDVVNQLIQEEEMKVYEINKHQERISLAFVSLLKKHKINKKIYSLINTYLNGNGTWSSDNISINWKSTQLQEWGDVNKKMVPHPGLNLSNSYKSRGFQFDYFKSNITGKKVKTFSQLVIHFKNLFHIRADNSLKDLIEYRNLKKWNDKVEFQIDNDSFWTNIELFTDVDKLLQAYDNIITMILDLVNEFNLPKPQIKISFIEEGDYVELSIHHRNTVFKKTMNNLINRIGESHTALIKKLVNGLCDLHIKADFDNNQYAHINLWDGEERKQTPIAKFEGVQHILLFKQ